nr:leucine-rich repeat-containing protein [Tanacetum cinerariifolium]
MSYFYSVFLFLCFAYSTCSYSFLNTTTNIKCSDEQKHSLLLFKQNLVSINYSLDVSFGSYTPCEDWLGSSYYYPLMMSWKTSTDCCKWNGVTCDYSTGDVVGLDVSCGMLKGTIHPNSSLYNLPRLQRLNLAFNDFDGSQIPRQIRRFSNSLINLNLSYCGFSGHVPSDITFLSKLVSLDLSYNYYFDLKPRDLNNIFQNFSKLEKLSLEGVNVSSALPTSLNISSSLKLLELASTGLQGILPHNIFNFHYLETLDLGENYLTGYIPSKVSVNLTHLTYLSLSDNMLSGNVPFELFAVPSLQVLELGNNHLAGHIDMQTFRKLTNLIVLDLPFNNFSGEWELDTLLTNNRNLEYLDLSYNGFSLTTKNGNHYVNPGFRRLNLASCKLKVFPISFRAMIKLEELDLSSNEIRGHIPLGAGEIGGNVMYYVNLSHNFITGVPRFHWPKVNELFLQYNMIQGPFPPSICNLTDLWHLDLSNNRFSGVIPECVRNFVEKESLSSMDLGTNHFQGTIPNVFSDCKMLMGLILNGNHLEGEVPSSLSKCNDLMVLDLANNQLNGTFPNWLEDLPNLQALVLRSNNFHGSIVTHSTVQFPFPVLQVLDISHNRFIGKLPAKYIQNFQAMKNVVKESRRPSYLNMDDLYYSFVAAVKGVDQDFQKVLVGYTIIDLSNNSFDSEIPNIFGNLCSLKVLNLSHNNLNGRIPYSFGNLSEVESLDLSWNQLTGEIPESLAGIKRLAVLHLSHNRLVGRIPGGTQFNTFDESSFEGNVGLCGFPLPKTCSKYTHKPQPEAEEHHEEESGFTWEVVTLGYGCGALLGLVMGYLMLSTRKVKWFNAIADAGEHMILMRNKRRYVFIGK